MLSEAQRKALAETVERAERQVAPAVPYIMSRGITKETAQRFRLGYEEQGEYAGRLAIPYLAADGSVVDVRFRAIDADTSPKYMSRHGSKAHLFNVSALLSDGDTIHVTEGEIDCMTLTQLGVPAVGIPGATQWQKHWSRLFTDYDRVIVLCDGDQAGTDFGRKMMEKIHAATVVHLPDGQDVNSLFTQQEAYLRGLVSA